MQRSTVTRTLLGATLFSAACDHEGAVTGDYGSDAGVENLEAPELFEEATDLSRQIDYLEEPDDTMEHFATSRGRSSIELAIDEDGGLGLAIGGPVADNLEGVMQAYSKSSSPLDFLLAVDPDFQDVARLQQASDRAVAAGSWHKGEGAEPLPEIGEDVSAQAEEATDDLAVESDPLPATLAACDYLDAYGTTAENHGGCTLYYRDLNEETNWYHNDLVASGAHVTSVTGSQSWVFKKRNCNLCNYSTLYSTGVPAGYHYFAQYDSMNNDHRAVSTSTTTSSSSSHYHEFSVCKDYGYRTSWIAHGGGNSCKMQYDSPGTNITFICHNGPYEGPDPSPIFTCGTCNFGGGSVSCP